MQHIFFAECKVFTCTRFKSWYIISIMSSSFSISFPKHELFDKAWSLLVGKLCIYEAMVFSAGWGAGGKIGGEGYCGAGGAANERAAFSSHYLSRFSSPPPAPRVHMCVSSWRHDVTRRDDDLASSRADEWLRELARFFPACTVASAVSLALALARTDAVRSRTHSHALSHSYQHPFAPTPFAPTPFALARTRTHSYRRRSLSLALISRW